MHLVTLPSDHLEFIIASSKSLNSHWANGIRGQFVAQPKMLKTGGVKIILSGHFKTVPKD